MKRIILHILFICTVLVVAFPKISESITVNSVVGVAATCDLSDTDCLPFPSVVSQTCSNLVNPATCPTVFHPSWVDSNRLWGVSGSIGGGNFECVTSTNQGLTWNTCTTQPWSIGQQHQVASTENGNLISVADIAGTCTIRLSTDNAASWATVFTNPGVQCAMGVRAQIVYCQRDVEQCDVGNTLSGLSARLHRSIDNGVTWTVSAPGDALLAPTLGGIEFNGEQGIFGSDGMGAGLKAVVSTGNVWVGSSAWSPSALDRGTPLLFNQVSTQVISQNGATSVYHRTDENGTLIQSISPPGVLGALGAGLRAIFYRTGMYYVVGPGTTGEVIWLTRDDFATFVTLFTSTAATGRITMYNLGSVILISLNSGGVVGTFFRITQ